MAEALEAVLDLDFSDSTDALQRALEDAFESAADGFSRALENTVDDLVSSLRDLDRPLEDAGQAFGDALDQALTNTEGRVADLEPGLQTAGEALQLSLDDAITQAEGRVPDLEPPLQAAGDTLGTSLDDAITTASTGLENMPASVDTAMVEDSITSAIDEADTTVIVDGVDVSALDEGIADAMSQIEPAIIPVEVDDADAIDALEGVAQEAEDAGTSVSQSGSAAREAAGGYSSLATGANIVSGATAIATRNTGAFQGVLGSVAGRAGATAAGVIGVGLAFSSLLRAGEAVVASQERMNLVFGDTAGAVQRIDVGGLTGDMSDLATQVGSSGSAVKEASANLGQLGIAAGRTAPAVKGTVQQVAALAIRAVALNPSLGEAGSVMERLNLALGRGGPRLARYGLSLTSTEINMRALADTGKSTVSQLTQFDKTAAAAAIATERLGTSLGEDVRRGSEQAAVQLKRLAAEAKSALGEIGAPLVKPMIEAFKSLQPVVIATGQVLGKIASGALPAVAAAFAGVTAVVEPFLSVLQAIPGPILAVGLAVALLVRHFGSLSGSGMAFLVTSTRISAALQTWQGKLAAGVIAVAALEVALNALGTSGKDLGIQFTEMGFAIGSAFGVKGAAIGAAIGGIIDLITHTSALDEALASIDAAFGDTVAGADEMGAALYNAATSAEALGTALDNVGTNLSVFLEKNKASAFVIRNQTDDIKRLGLGFSELANMATDGKVGLAAFFDAAVSAGEISNNLKTSLEKITLAGGDFTSGLTTQEEKTRKVNATLRELGVGMRITGAEYASLNAKSRQRVLTILQEAGGNADLIASLEKTQRQLQAAGKAEFDLFAASNHMSRGIVAAAKEMGGANAKTRDWRVSLEELERAQRGVGLAINSFGSNVGTQMRVFGELGGAIDAAIKALPTLGSYFDEVAKRAEAFGGVTEKTAGAITEGLNAAAAEAGTFFQNISTIMQQGQPALAAALLELGPSNLGARAAAQLAANNPFISAGWEQALQGLARGQIVIETILNEQRSRVTLLSTLLGTTMGEGFAAGIGKANMADATNDELLAVAQVIAAHPKKYGPQAAAAAEDYIRQYTAAGAAAIDQGTPAMTEAQKRQVDATLAELAKMPPKQREKVIEAAKAAQQEALNQVPGFEEGGRKQGDAHVKGFDEKAREQKNALGRAITEAIAEGTRHTGLMAESGRALANGFANGLKEGTPQAVTAGQGIVTATALGMALGSAAFATAGLTGALVYSAGISAGGGNALTAGMSLATAAAAGAVVNFGAFLAAGQASGAFYAVGVVGTAGSALGAGQTIGAVSAAGARATVGLFLSAGIALGVAFANAVRSTAGLAAAAGYQLVVAGAGGMRNTGLFAAAGQACGSAFVKALDAQRGAAAGAGRGLVEAGAGAMRNTGLFAAAGSAAGAAYARALAAQAGAAEAAARAIVRAAEAGARHASPDSRIHFIKIGAEHGEAYASAFATIAPAAEAAAKSVVRAAARGAGTLRAPTPVAQPAVARVTATTDQAAIERALTVSLAPILERYAASSPSITVNGGGDPVKAAREVSRELAFQRRFAGVR